MDTTKIVDGYKMDIDRNLDENMLFFSCGYAFFLLRLSSACFDWLTIKEKKKKNVVMELPFHISFLFVCQSMSAYFFPLTCLNK